MLTDVGIAHTVNSLANEQTIAWVAWQEDENKNNMDEDEDDEPTLSN